MREYLSGGGEGRELVIPYAQRTYNWKGVLGHMSCVSEKVGGNPRGARHKGSGV